MSRDYENRPVTQRVLAATTCDGCGRRAEGDPEGWHHFDTHHGEWGNDSVESFEYYDACSFECYLTIVAREYWDLGQPPARTWRCDDMPGEFVRSMLMYIGNLEGRGR